MKLSLQIGRGLIALTLCMAFAACAVSQPADESPEQANLPKVAHSRLAIVDLHDNGDKPHWVVAGVRVGDPVFISDNGSLSDSRPHAPRRTGAASIGG